MYHIGTDYGLLATGSGRQQRKRPLDQRLCKRDLVAVVLEWSRLGERGLCGTPEELVAWFGPDQLLLSTRRAWGCAAPLIDRFSDCHGLFLSFQSPVL
jgi:hypothetical protein